MTRHSDSTRLLLAFAAALLAPAALAQAVPVMTTSSDGTTFRIDVTGGGPNKAIYFLRLPAGIDQAILPDVYAAAAAGATLVHTTSTDAAGEFHASFPVSIFPQEVVFAGYGARALRFLGTMLPNPSQSSVLVPGVGFSGATPEPPRIGAGTARAIARWDVVPYQTITEASDPTFVVGVVAFHIAGIEKVSFSLEGGPWADVRTMSLNPQTGVWEYCATIDARDFANDRPIEVRAIAYPKAAAPQAAGTGGYPGGGDPRLLESLFLYVDADGARAPNVAYCSPAGSDSTGSGTAANPFRTPWRAARAVAAAGGGSADGGIVYMDAGSYEWGQPGGGSVPATGSQWLTFTAWPGVTRDQVRITAGGYPGMAINRVRLHEITLNRFVHGDDGGSGGSDLAWLDHVTCQGAGQATSTHFGGWTPGFVGRYYTDTEISDDQWAVAGGDLARNVTARRIRQFHKSTKLMINCVVDDISHAGTDDHPNFLNWNFTSTLFDNFIVYGVTATGVDAHTLVKQVSGLTNTALVNVAMQGEGAASTHFGQQVPLIDHVLVWNCTWGQRWLWETPQANMRHVSVRGSLFDSMAINGPAGGDSVNPAWFADNHFSSGGFIPGTGASTGDPMLGADFAPGPGSPLRGRLASLLAPIDKNGAPRAVPATVGAVE